MCARGWNQPSVKSSKKCRRGTSAASIFKWLSLCAVVVLLAVAGYYFFAGGKGSEKKSSEPSDVKPAKKQGGAVATSDRDKGAAEVSAKTNKVSADPVRKVETQDVSEAVVSNEVGGAQQEDASTEDKRLFKNAMDQLLAMVAPKNVGDSVPPLPIVDGMEFSEEDEKKILERLTADDDDSDAVLDRKEIVQAMRDEYQELKKHGWTFIDYLKALEAKANLDTEVLEESHMLHDTVFDDPAISDEKYFETLEKINKILADRGIEQIKPPTDENEEEK